MNNLMEAVSQDIEELTILTVYQQIFDDLIKIMNFRFPQRADRNTIKQTSLIRAHQYFAIKYLGVFPENFAQNLDLSYDPYEWPLEDFACFGIIDYDKDKNITFNHRTYAEYLVASYMFYALKNNRLFTRHFVLLYTILTEQSFKIVRMFLEELFKRFKYANATLIANADNFCEFLAKNKVCSNIFRYPASECHTMLLKFVFDLLQKKEEILRKMVMLVDEDNETFLMHFAKECCDEGKVSEILSIIENSYKKDIYKLIVCTDNYDQNVSFKVATTQNKKIIVSIINFIKSGLKYVAKPEVEFFSKRDKNSNFIMHIVAQFSETEEVFKLFWNNLPGVIDTKIKYLDSKNNEGNTILHVLLKENKDPHIFAYAFDLSVKYCSSLKNLIMDKNNKNLSVLGLAVCHATRDNLEKVIELLKNLHQEDKEIKNIIKSTKGECKRNLLSLATYNKDPDSIILTWKFIENYLDIKEITNMILDIDENKDDLIHNAASFASRVEIFEYIWEKISNNLNKSFMAYVNKKGNCKRNILLTAVYARNPITLRYILENYYNSETKKDVLEIIREQDNKRQNLLHYIGRYGTREMLETVDELQIDQTAKNILIKEFLKDSISQYGIRNFPIYCAVENNTLDVFNSFVALYDRYFDVNERKEIYTPMEKLAMKNKIEKHMIDAVKETLSLLACEEE